MAIDLMRQIDKLFGERDELRRQLKINAIAENRTADESDRLKEISAELLEACKLAETELEYLLALKLVPERPSGIRAIKAIKYALAKTTLGKNNPATPERRVGMAWPGLQTGEGIK